ncbi:uncharacterized protein [Antedon mediterranea]|uniref:uncharacterized protein n=1 Tax=Antedon mediterranea TaxID=105859 RepID=UPI003AF4563C
MKPTARSNITDVSKVTERKKKSKDGNASRKKPKRVSAAAVKNHPATKILSTETSQSNISANSTIEPYKERMVSGKVLSRWKVMTKASQEQIITILDSVISCVLVKVKDSSYQEIQAQLGQLKQRIMRNLTSLKVPPMKDYKKLQQQCSILEETLVENKVQSEALDEEIERMEKLIEAKEEELTTFENRVGDAENNNDIGIHPVLEDPYVDQLGLPPLPNPVGYFADKKQVENDLNLQVNMLQSPDCQEISHYMNSLLHQEYS